MEIIVLIFSIFGIGFFLGIGVQRFAYKSNPITTTEVIVHQQKIKERK